VSKVGCYGPRQPTRFSTRARAIRIELVASGRLGAVAKDRLKLARRPQALTGWPSSDAPDIDSVERDNRELADLLVEAAISACSSLHGDPLRRPGAVGGAAPCAGSRSSLVVVLNACRMMKRIGRRRCRREALFHQAAHEGDEEPMDLIAIDEGDIEPRVNGLAREKARPLLERIDRLLLRPTARAIATRALAGALRASRRSPTRSPTISEHEAIDADALRRIAASMYATELEVAGRRACRAVSPAGRGAATMETTSSARTRWQIHLHRYRQLRAMLLTVFRGRTAAPVTIIEAELTSTIEALGCVTRPKPRGDGDGVVDRPEAAR